MGIPEPLRRSVAAHEAGHAAVADLLGIRVVHASLEPDSSENEGESGTWGHVRSIRRRLTWGDSRWLGRQAEREFEAQMLADLAGPLAERQERGRLGQECALCGHVDCSSGDLQDCLNAAFLQWCGCDSAECEQCHPWRASAHPAIDALLQGVHGRARFERCLTTRFLRCDELLRKEAVQTAVKDVTGQLFDRGFLTGQEIRLIVGQPPPGLLRYRWRAG